MTTMCKLCSKPIEKGKYCRRCKLQQQSKWVTVVEKGGETLMAMGAAITVSVVASIIEKKRNSFS